MIEITNVDFEGWKHAIRGMRNSHNSWHLSDSEFSPGHYKIGPNDNHLMKTLARSGSSHAKYRRMIVVWCDIKAPLYWWKEFDTYKVGTVANSTSTMHSITDKPFEKGDFSLSHTDDEGVDHVLDYFNGLRDRYIVTGDKNDWYRIIEMLPSGYLQTRTVMMNYEVLHSMFADRLHHKLDEWRIFCDWVVTALPAPYLITLGDEEND